MEFQPVTPERMGDLARFSSTHGKFRDCSCMRRRLTSLQYRHSTTAERLARLEQQVHQNKPVGVPAYAGDEPIGSYSIAPRPAYAALERSRCLPRVDDEPVGCVVCFHVDRRVRHQGVGLGLVRAAVENAQS
jgi:hypothetical protein